jgi:hypothetical protein
LISHFQPVTLNPYSILSHKVWPILVSDMGENGVSSGARSGLWLCRSMSGNVGKV